MISPYTTFDNSSAVELDSIIVHGWDEQFIYEGLMEFTTQTDFDGMSGPILDSEGTVVGLAIASSNQGRIFAIPWHEVAPALPLRLDWLRTSQD